MHKLVSIIHVTSLWLVLIDGNVTRDYVKNGTLTTNSQYWNESLNSTSDFLMIDIPPIHTNTVFYTIPIGYGNDHIQGDIRIMKNLYHSLLDSYDLNVFVFGKNPNRLFGMTSLVRLIRRNHLNKNQPIKKFPATPDQWHELPY